MTVEFISLINVWESSELHPRPGGAPDPAYIRKYARYLEYGGFDYTLVAYGSGGYDPFTVSATIAAHTERIKPIVALRPNIMYPTVAAQSLATLDHLSGGRAVVHIISGGSDQEQARQGDYISKDDRYARSEEYVTLMRRAWTETTPWDHDGRFYQFKNFVAGYRPVNGTIPVSIGGSSAEAYRVGGALGDIFGLWGEPLADTRQQMDRVAEQARRAGRTDVPRTWVTFRPIIAETDSWPGRRPAARSASSSRPISRAPSRRCGWPRRAARRTSARSGSWRSPRAATCTTARCGCAPRPSPAPWAPRPRWSAATRPWPPPCSTTLTSAPT
jgi:alkanesulfonate monooxygenase